MINAKDLLNENLKGHFRPNEVISRSETAYTFHAVDIRNQQQIIIKYYLDHSESIIRDEIQSAVRLQAQARSESTVPVIDFGEHKSGGFWVVLEKQKSPNLLRYLRGQGRCQPAQVVQILDRVCDALAPLHEEKRIHGNLKPTNLFLGPNDKIKSLKVSDYAGLNLCKVHKFSSGRVTYNDPSYFSYEQASGKPLSPQTDIAALGILGYLLLSGDQPFEGRTTDKVLTSVIIGSGRVKLTSDQLLDSSSLESEKLVEVIHRCLSKNANDRYASATALRDALQEVLDWGPTVLDSSMRVGLNNMTMPYQAIDPQAIAEIEEAQAEISAQQDVSPPSSRPMNSSFEQRARSSLDSLPILTPAPPTLMGNIDFSTLGGLGLSSTSTPFPPQSASQSHHSPPPKVPAQTLMGVVNPYTELSGGISPRDYPPPPESMLNADAASAPSSAPISPIKSREPSLNLNTLMGTPVPNDLNMLVEKTSLDALSNIKEEASLAQDAIDEMENWGGFSSPSLPVQEEPQTLIERENTGDLISALPSLPGFSTYQHADQYDESPTAITDLSTLEKQRTPASSDEGSPSLGPPVHSTSAFTSLTSNNEVNEDTFIGPSPIEISPQLMSQEDQSDTLNIDLPSDEELNAILQESMIAIQHTADLQSEVDQPLDDEIMAAADELLGSLIPPDLSDLFQEDPASTFPKQPPSQESFKDHQPEPPSPSTTSPALYSGEFEFPWISTPPPSSDHNEPSNIEPEIELFSDPVKSVAPERGGADQQHTYQTDQDYGEFNPSSPNQLIDGVSSQSREQRADQTLLSAKKMPDLMMDTYLEQVEVSALFPKVPAWQSLVALRDQPQALADALLKIPLPLTGHLLPFSQFQLQIEGIGEEEGFFIGPSEMRLPRLPSLADVEAQSERLSHSSEQERLGVSTSDSSSNDLSAMGGAKIIKKRRALSPTIQKVLSLTVITLMLSGLTLWGASALDLAELKSLILGTSYEEMPTTRRVNSSPSVTSFERLKTQQALSPSGRLNSSTKGLPPSNKAMIKVSLTTRPNGAEVWISDTFKGKTPFKFEASESVTLEFRLKGYETATQSVTYDQLSAKPTQIFTLKRLRQDARSSEVTPSRRDQKRSKRSLKKTQKNTKSKKRRKKKKKKTFKNPFAM
jgi:hypothetical protein